MNYSNCKKITLSLLLMLNCSYSLFAHDGCAQPTSTIQESPEFYAQLAQEICEAPLKKVLLQFNKVDSLLEDLSLVIDNNQIKQIINKRAANDGLKGIRGIIDGINKETFATLTPENIVYLNNQLADIITIISNAIATDFNSIDLLDENAYVNLKRIFTQGMTEEDLDFEAQWNMLEQKIASLDNQTKNVGLRWYNKGYRKLNDYVIQPSIKHRVPQRLAMAGLVAAAATYCWWRTNRGTKVGDNPANLQIVPDLDAQGSPIKINGEAVFKTTLIDVEKQTTYYAWEEQLRERLGHYRHTTDGTNSLDDKGLLSFHLNGRNPIKNLAEVEKKMYDYNHYLMPLGTLLYGYKSLYDGEATNSYNWFKKKVVTAHNHLLGGAYASQKLVSDDGMTTTIKPRYTFDDIVGMEDEKNMLDSFIIKFIQDPERWKRGGLTQEKGYLFTGPTRTGKSFMFEALCGEIQRALKAQGRNPDEFAFFNISATLIEAKGMEWVMDAAKREAPCVLFIDEIDLLKLQRANGNTTLLNQFLTCMSGALESDPQKQVFILAATNKPENMDEALKQAGRFGKEIRFDYPNFNYRKSYLTKRLSPLCFNLDAFDLNKIALETAGCSFQKLNDMISVAFTKARIRGHALTQELLENALDSEIRLILQGDAKDIPQSEKKLLSAHQAGHTLATMLLKTTHEVAKVTIRPVQTKLKEEMAWDALYKEEEDKQNPIEYGRLFTYQKNDTLNINSKEEMINMCKIQLAGHIAEEVLNGSSGYTYHKQDSQRAMQIATAVVCEGLRMDRLPKTIQNEMFDKAFKLLNTCKQEMRALFTEHATTLQAIANELQKNLTLTDKDIEIIMQTGTLPDASATKKADVVNMASELGIKEELPTA